MISIVCVYNDERILKEYLLDSLENQTSQYELILMNNTQGEFKSAAEALNRGGVNAKGKYIMFVHQDVHLRSNSWLETTEKLLDSIANLGIAGTAGARAGKPRRMWELVTNIEQGIPPMNIPSAVPLREPVKVQTLDESLIIIPRPVFDRLHFDEEVCDDWHLYAVDYSLSVARLAFDVYVIPAFIHHRSIGKPNENVWQVIRSMRILPSGYYRTVGKLSKKHGSYTKDVYATTGWWSNTYPVTLRRATEVLNFVTSAVLRIIVDKGIVSKPRNLFKRILSSVKHFPDSDVPK
jgi:glycosyltransferase involved in cell wall biosynthesis